jgi:hypothetical protein
MILSLRFLFGSSVRKTYYAVRITEYVLRSMPSIYVSVANDGAGYACPTAQGSIGYGYNFCQIRIM